MCVVKLWWPQQPWQPPLFLLYNVFFVRRRTRGSMQCGVPLQQSQLLLILPSCVCVRKCVSVCANARVIVSCRWKLCLACLCVQSVGGMSAYPGTLPLVKRTALADFKSGLPVYQPSAAAATASPYQQALTAIQYQPTYVPMSCT